MKKWLLLLLSLLLLSPSLRAQLPSPTDVPVDIESDNTSFDNGVAIAQGHVVIRYKTTTIYCDYAQYDRDTGDALAKGNVRIYSDGHLFTGERAVYNFLTKELHAADFHGDFYPFNFSTQAFGDIGPNAYQARNATMTTSDSSKPDYYLQAKSVRIYPHDRVIFSNVTLYVGKTPIFWYPYLYQSLQKDTGFVMRPGYESIWGAYLLTEYGFPVSENVNGKLHLDVRSLRGAAGGLDLNYKYGQFGESWGKFISYYANDTKPEKNDTSYIRGPVPSERYRISLQGRSYLTDDVYATMNVNKLSDALFLQDFVPSQFRVDPQPDSVVDITKWSEDYTITGIGRAQLNNFFQTTERLPELDLDIKRQSFMDTPLFFEGDTSVSRLTRDFEKGSPFPDYSTTRVDSFIQFLYPKTYFGWLTFTPRVGVEGTYYSSSGNSGPTIFDFNAGTQTPFFPTAQSPLSVVPSTPTPLVKHGGLFRPVLTAGFESSFKISRSFDDVESHDWGLDGLRHVIQPYTNFSYVYTGQNPNKILQFDRINPSTQLPPLDLSEFNSTDAITNWTVWRFGVRNRLETRRDNDVFNWLTLDSFVNVNLREPQYPGINYRQGTFSNFFNNLTWNPLPWLGASLDSQVPISSKGFTEVNSSLNFMVDPNFRFSVGDAIINDNPFFTNSNLITFSSYYRINDNWALSAREQYETNNHQLQYQSYELHRDLSSWTASFGFYVRDNQVNGFGSVDYGVSLVFTLKDYPSISSPISFDPSSSGQGR